MYFVHDQFILHIMDIPQMLFYKIQTLKTTESIVKLHGLQYVMMDTVPLCAM